MPVRYYIKKNKSKVSTIYLSLNRYGSRFNKSTGLMIPEEHWNKKRGLPKPANSEAEKIKIILENAEQELDLYLGQRRSKEEINHQIDIIFKGEELSFFQVFDKFLDHQRERKGEASFKKYRTIKRNLQAFAKDEGRVLSFEDIDETLGEDFSHWYHKKDYSPNTSGRAMGFLKTFMSWALKRGYHSSRSWEALKKTQVDKEVTFLSMEELLSFKDADLPDHLGKVRDLFCLGCFTGLRYSDLSQLTQDEIQGDVLILRTEKDEDRLEIPITGLAREILDKYAEGLPKISNQKGNEHLKKAAQGAELDRKILVTKWQGGKRADTYKRIHEMISWHMARRTFITLSLELGMDPTVIIRITGHSDTKTLKPYLAVTDKLKKEQMSQAWGSGTLRKVN